METPELFIQPTPSSTNSLFISREFLNENFSTDIISFVYDSMDLYSIWRVSIADTHVGWEFIKEIPVTLIKYAIEKALNNTWECEIIGE